jgi:hypothetical protein
LLSLDRATLEDSYVSRRMSRAQEKGEREGAAYLQSQPRAAQPLDDARLRRFMARMEQLDARVLLRRARPDLTIFSIQGTDDHVVHPEKTLEPSHQRAMGWFKHNFIPGQGIILHTKKPVPYPEVTGYYIPTLYHWKETELRPFTAPAG